MTQGYITIATKSPGNVQIEQAVVLASSLKLIDPDREFCLVVDKFDSVPQKYEDTFDSIVELPYGHYDPTEDIAINLWQLYACSTFEHTMYIDRRCIVTNNMDDLWDNMVLHDYIFSKSVENFRGETVPLEYRFSTHERNDIPTYMTDVFYFNRSERSEQLFKMLDVVLKEFRRVYLKFINENRPGYFDLNLLINTTLKMLGEETNIHGHIPYKLLSLDNLTLDDDDLPTDWIDYLSSWFANGVFKVNNHRVSGIICYNSDAFLDEEILDDYRQRVKDSNIRI
jgi:hypothetical protein